MNVESITIILPSYNTLNYLLMAYQSLRKYYPNNDIFIPDDGSTDGSSEWLAEQLKVDNHLTAWFNSTGKIVGHTCTYNRGVQQAKTEFVSIFHSDMICYRNYLENMLKHWKPKTVVSATRIEPAGIYPPGNEKILKSFGLEHFEFKRQEFEDFCEQEMKDSANKTTRGIFAPFLMLRSDYMETGGMEELRYAPFPEEDASFFLRLALAGYALVQSRDSLLYHWISRGHRNWAQNGIGKDGPDFKFYQTRARRNYLREWGRWMKFDEYQHPITHKVFDVGFILRDVVSVEFLHLVEPWAKAIYTDNEVITKKYVDAEQPTTAIDLSYRIFNADFAQPFQPQHDIIIEFSEKDFVQGGQENVTILQNLNTMLNDVESNSVYEYGIFKVTTHDIKDHAQELIVVKN